LIYFKNPASQVDYLKSFSEKIFKHYLAGNPIFSSFINQKNAVKNYCNSLFYHENERLLLPDFGRVISAFSRPTK
jgi:hypothetical protein